MQESKKRLPKAVFVLSAIALLGFKDTGIFVENFSATLNNGIEINYSINDQVKILGEGNSGTTYKVQGQGQEFYVPKNILDAQDQDQDFYVEENATLVDENNNIVRLLFMDEHLECLEDRGDVILAKAKKDGSVGIVEKKALRTSKTPNRQKQNKESKKEETYVPAPLPDGPMADKVIAMSKQYLGRTYVWGDTGKEGFDCSGLVYSVYQDVAKVKLPRTSREMAKVGKTVKKEDLQKGDLLFFNDGKGGTINHVAMYIGNDEMIHASNSQKGVVIDSLDGNYFKNNFTHAQRVL